MTKKIFIVSMAFVLTACGSMASLIPLDDAYYYPDDTPKVYTETSPSREISKPATANESATSGEPAVSGPSAPTMEILSAQDTTITVRIKR